MAGAGDNSSDQAFRRRTMLKAAAAAGVGAVAWSAPRIETLGFLPAAAATPCTILSPGSQDKNSNKSLAGVYCAQNGGVNNFPCCTAGHVATDFGNSGNQFEVWTFANPHPGCSEIVVRLVSLDCNVAPDPSLARQALVITSETGTCDCVVDAAVLLRSSGREFVQDYNSGSFTCTLPIVGEVSGIDASISCTDADLINAGPSARLAVRILCQTGNPGCVPVL